MVWRGFWIGFLCTLAVSVAGSAARADEPEPTISVSGSAEIRVVPDQVVITAAVESRAEEVSAACKDNQTSIRTVIDFLKASGIDPKHISTEYISIEPIPPRPVYMLKGNLAQQSNAPFEEETQEGQEPGQPIGYVARRQFAITITNLDKFEEIYRGLIERGINRVSGIEFRTSQLRQHRDEARLKAVRAAKEKAQAMAGELGATLSAIKSISETQESFGRANIQNNISDPFGGEVADEALAAGQIQITAAVDVVFYLGNTAMDN